ncbi:AraC family transcriptional regulator [Solimonas sp. K1W22B-7]|uniref:helix-turn-helix transcriptional regulator n=1 Tax=Solimonas sp. K1W22B-7 TaxID=2303331 RepID=UPI000E32FB13|nr:AraC family transcriptional regulator [Solimonas sp. K1W22B-7]
MTLIEFQVSASDKVYPLLGAQGRGGHGDFKEVVPQLALRTDGTIAPLGEVAERLCVSARTLKRRLRQDGLTYRAVVDAIRLKRSLEFLRHRGLSVEYIAEKLGYSSAANFTRAFRRWTGSPPHTYRCEVLCVPRSV